MTILVDWLTLPQTSMTCPFWRTVLVPEAMSIKARRININFISIDQLIFNYNYQSRIMKANSKGPAQGGPRGLFYEAVWYLARGIIAGVVFQGTFLMFSFQNRIIRSVTSNRLDQIKQLEEETASRIQRGEKPLIDLSLLRDQYVQKLKQSELKVNQ